MRMLMDLVIDHGSDLQMFEEVLRETAVRFKPWIDLVLFVKLISLRHGVDRNNQYLWKWSLFIGIMAVLD